MNKVNLIKAETVRKWQAFDVTANKDQLRVNKNGEVRVLEFAFEMRIFYITNGGFVGSAMVPMREMGPVV